MQVPLEIAFHNLDHSDWAEDQIRDHVARLEDIYNRLTSCRVRVDQRANNANQTIPPVVRIEIGIPGYKDIVVSHEPEHLQRRFQRPDLHNAINEAFRIAERQLSEFKERLADRKTALTHEAANEFLGQVAEVQAERDHGFVLTKEGGLLYFHRNAVLVGDFDRLKRGDAVSYVEEVGDTGPIATKVRLRSGSNGSAAQDGSA
ncbi:HPF/RaiA family ribosome-associated protein [Pseudorhodoplanes sp.]|jgi:ribosome-associated translation inhibitor RaiA/cold shock CspA family protein|uniref:HPF/RaiA family ribosome-associated protein n=1 Tax=Pseudorhodoplanes sp. TaxID=1934341 RepID=UPI002C861A7B|nr:HPF/RaiA family ribosome-associated protein [Pseudorhodoplanes sp.]HWV42786.1 HPF/RaiA family ribosome-associated protein [Pseudorhodoplanes sp.]